MKAAVLFGKNDIRYADWPEPAVTPGTVKIRVRACGICGSDIPRVLQGQSHFFPCVLGHEMAGEVVETGEDVQGLEIGTHVSVAPLKPCMRCDDCQRGDYALCKGYSFIGSREQGGFAEFLTVPAQNIVPFDDTLPYELGALFEPSTVALHGILKNGVEPGADAAVIGAGTIGLLTMRWLKLLGAAHVDVYDIDPDRLAIALSMGADGAFPSNSDNGRRYHQVYETAGHPDAMKLSFNIARNRARVCFIGTTHAAVTFPPDHMTLMNRKEFTLTGSWMSFSAPFPGREWQMTAEWASDGRLDLNGLIYAQYPLDACAEAFKLFEEPGKVKGRVMLIP